VPREFKDIRLRMSIFDFWAWLAVPAHVVEATLVWSPLAGVYKSQFSFTWGDEKKVSRSIPKSIARQKRKHARTTALRLFWRAPSHQALILAQSPQVPSLSPLFTSTFTSTRRFNARPWESLFVASGCVAP
jgi:hypothetical protein